MSSMTTERPRGLIARFLPLPNVVVLPLARKLVAADPSARSSTLQDLEAGKTTEIGYLNGAIVELAARHGLTAPANAVLTFITRLARLPNSTIGQPRWVASDSRALSGLTATGWPTASSIGRSETESLYE